MEDHIEEGTSLINCSSISLQAPNFSIRCSGEFENFTKWPIIFQSCDIKHGSVNVPFRTILPATREGFAIHKYPYSYHGCWVKCHFKIGSTGSYLHVMIFQPFSYVNNRQNHLSINISDQPEVTFDSLWENRKECTNSCSVDVCVESYIGTGPEPLINIRIRPLIYQCLSQPMKIGDCLNEIFFEIYQDYLKNKFLDLMEIFKKTLTQRENRGKWLHHYHQHYEISHFFPLNNVEESKKWEKQHSLGTGGTIFYWQNSKI